MLQAILEVVEAVDLLEELLAVVEDQVLLF
jgi:hypothetical protein